MALDPKIEHYLRAMSGDIGTGSEQDVPPEYVEKYYDETGGKPAATIVKMIKHRIGKRINDTQSTGQLGERNADLVERLRNILLPIWDKEAALEAQETPDSFGSLYAGGLSLGIDTTCPEEWS